MKIAPFGVLKVNHARRKTGLFTPMYEWSGTQSDFQKLMETWLDDIEDTIWPRWDGSAWVGKAAKTMDQATKDELTLAVNLYHNRPSEPVRDILDEIPDVPGSKPFSQQWHYEIEDARVLDRKYAYIELAEGEEPSFDYRASSTIGSNFLAYLPSTDITRFEHMFWGRMRGIQPPIWDIKDRLQRPRPAATAALFDIKDFRWITGTSIIHTGGHPAILSGHCVQGILGGCSVLDARIDEIEDTGGGLSDPEINGLLQYMVDWGDRRVFAGVHYMTDNIASWIMARRLIPHLFRNAKQVENFAVRAITQQSRVYKDIIENFDQFEALAPARALLVQEFEEDKAEAIA